MFASIKNISIDDGSPSACRECITSTNLVIVVNMICDRFTTQESLAIVELRESEGIRQASRKAGRQAGRQAVS